MLKSEKKVSWNEMKKRLSLLLALALCVSLLGACGGPSGEESQAPAGSNEPAVSDNAGGEQDTTLRALTLVAAETFNPLVYGNTDKPVNHALFDCLFRFDNDGNAVPMLVDTYEEDGLDVTMHLRQDVTFSSGNPLTADDVVFSYNAVLADPTLRYNMTGISTGMEKVDEYTIVLHLTNTYCKWENYLAELLYIIEEETYDPEADYTTTAPVGSGPYTLESVDAARKVTLKAREDYWNGAPEFKTVEVSAGVEDATALIALQTGDADLVAQMGLASYTQAQGDENLTCVSFDGWSTMGVMIQMGDDAFRQAIFHAINRDTIIQICNGGNGTPSTNYFSPKVMGDYTDKAPFVGYDVELAKECLANTAVDLSQTFEIQVFEATAQSVAQCIQSDLAAIGINVEVSFVDSNVFFDNLVNGNMQMGITAMATDMVGVEDMMSMFDPESGYPFSLSDEIIEMVQTAPYIQDDAERQAAVIELLNALNEACPWVPLYDSPMYCVYSNRVGNVLDCSCATYAYYFGDMTIEG